VSTSAALVKGGNLKYPIMIMSAKFATATALAAMATIAHAEPGQSADQLLVTAGRVLQQIDLDREVSVWAEMAPFVKTRVPKDQFVSATQHARQSVGAVERRGWASITRIRYDYDPIIPDGLYANVDYTTTLVSGRTVYERLSFQLASDGQWHLTGYVPRETPGTNSTQPQVGRP
jgi:hypothetical protein